MDKKKYTQKKNNENKNVKVNETKQSLKQNRETKQTPKQIIMKQ